MWPRGYRGPIVLQKLCQPDTPTWPRQEQCPAGPSPGQQGGARECGQVAWGREEPRDTQTLLLLRGSPASDPTVVDLSFSFQGPQLALKPDPITFQGFRPPAGREVTLTSVLETGRLGLRLCLASLGPFPTPTSHLPSFPSLSPSDNTYKPASEPQRGFFLEMTKQIVLGACHSCEVLLKRNSV